LGERNFHSFYSLLHGASAAELAEFSLNSSAATYTFTSGGGNGVDRLSNVNDDKQNYRQVNDAFRVANFESATVKTIWSIVAAILHLGNVKFSSRDEEEKDMNNNSGKSSSKTQTNAADNNNNNNRAKISDDSLKLIKCIAGLLRLEEADLISAMTSRLIATGHKDLVTTYLTVKDAYYAKDALAKAMYEQLFTWIFGRMNEILDIKNTIEATRMGEAPLKTTVIGVLDIYGFEIFDNNG
jgi:myosin I